MERRKPAAIDRATALRYMGASGWTPDAATAALLDKAEQKVTVMQENMQGELVEQPFAAEEEAK